MAEAVTSPARLTKTRLESIRDFVRPRGIRQDFAAFPMVFGILLVYKTSISEIPIGQAPRFNPLAHLPIRLRAPLYAGSLIRLLGVADMSDIEDGSR
jgi:hypothetical protein